MDGLMIEIRGRNGERRLWPLRDGRLVVGRSPEADVHIDDRTISRRHAELFHEDDRWRIRDMGSRNGIYINGVKQSESTLDLNDEIVLGDVSLFLCRPINTTVGLDEVRQEQSNPDTASIKLLSDAKAPKIASSHFAGVIEFGRRLAELSDARERLQALCDVAVGPAFRGLHAKVLQAPSMDDATEEQSARVIAEAHADSAEAQATPASLSRSVLRALATKRQPIMAVDVNAGDAPFAVNLSQEFHDTGVLACPVQLGPDSRTLLYVDMPANRVSFDWLALLQLAVIQFEEQEMARTSRQRAMEMEVIERDLQRARQLIDALVPREPEVSGMQVAIGFDPCRWVGGDLVDVVPMPDGRVLLLIADVCGKGLDAAMVASGLHASIRTSIRSGGDLVSLTACLNDHLCDTMPEGRFVTALLVCIDPQSGELQIANAGHMSPMIVQPGNVVRQPEQGRHFPLGIAPIDVVLQHDRLEEDELLFIYTDGLTELMDPQGCMLNAKGLANLLVEIQEGSPDVAQLAQQMHQRLLSYSNHATQQDDMTFLLARRGSGKHIAIEPATT